MEWAKKITYNWNLKSKNKIGLKINVKIKLGQILGSTNMSISDRVHE